MISLEDRSAITELIALHGHLVDDSRLEELNLVFANDMTHELWMTSFSFSFLWKGKNQAHIVNSNITGIHIMCDIIS